MPKKHADEFVARVSNYSSIASASTALRKFKADKGLTKKDVEACRVAINAQFPNGWTENNEKYRASQEASRAKKAGNGSTNGKADEPLGD